VDDEVRAGVAKVLSTATSAPWRLAIRASAAMSLTRRSGFEGDSIQRSFVCSGRKAASTASSEVVSAKVNSSPNRS
jgi:hypothetical protein